MVCIEGGVFNLPATYQLRKIIYTYIISPGEIGFDPEKNGTKLNLVPFESPHYCE